MKLSWISRLTMPLPELAQYHREQRKIQFERGDKPKNIRLREMCYPIFRAFLMVDTNFTDNRQFHDINNSAYKEICAASVGKMEQDERNDRSPQSVADVALKLAGKKNPPIRVAVGIEYKLLIQFSAFFKITFLRPPPIRPRGFFFILPKVQCTCRRWFC